MKYLASMVLGMAFRLCHAAHKRLSLNETGRRRATGCSRTTTSTGASGWI